MNETIGWCVLAFSVGLSVGSFLIEWAWKNRIEEKARNGFRLECRGNLYTVKRDESEAL